MSTGRSTRHEIAQRLVEAGFPAAETEAREMFEAAGGNHDVLRCWSARRLEGQPLEWIIGYTTFMGHRIRVRRGVYVPRAQTEMLVARAIEILPTEGLAVDLCTGSGAIAVALQRSRPGARILASDIDPEAVLCAAENGVEVYQGHLAEPIAADLHGRFDVVIAVAPYVPTEELDFLPRDVRDHEPRTALDGGPGGLALVREVVAAAAGLLHPKGALIVEIGGAQDRALEPTLQESRFRIEERFVDEDGDLRGIRALLD
jgi:release factor glutamine methyltransferase